MQPVFNEMIKMWADMGYKLPITEGIYWYDNGIIKGFNASGELLNLYKVTIFDNLTISIKKHKDYKKNTDIKLETWKETATRMSNHLFLLEDDSLSLLKQYVSTDRTIIDTNSTGKDSEVKTYLAHKAGLNFTTEFNVTTLDVAASTVYAKEKGYKFVYPDLKKYGGFYQWIEREKLIPSRLNRACCTFYKEYATMFQHRGEKHLLFLFGMRNSESNNRSGYGDIWVNEKWKKDEDWVGVLPIRKWSDLDIWLYIFMNHLDFNKKYRMGYSRVGCACACPNYSKSTWVLDKYWYNTLYNRWRKILKDDFISNNKWLIMNCTIDEYVNICWNGGVYRKEPTKEVIEEYAAYSGLDVNIAKKYFNRYCMNGCLNRRKQPLKIKDKNTLGMNMKLYGRQIEKFKCKKCLMKEFDLTKEKWDEMVEGFKRNGCKLF